MSQDTLTGSASVSSSLMTNYLAATSVDAAFPLAAAEDAGGSPLLFSVGAATSDPSRKTLWVMLRDTTVTTGWRQVELSPDATRSVQGYAVVQAVAGEIVIAVAMDDGAGGSRVFVSPALTPTTDGSPWNTLNAAWVQRQGGPTGAPVQRLILGDFVNASEAPLLVTEVKNGSGTTGRYFVDASTSAMASAWINWAPPKDVQTLHDVVVARASITGDTYRGTWTLYDDTSGKRCLTFTSLLDHNSTSHTLSVQAPAGARCLWALADRAHSGLSALYVGGDGLSWFPSTGLKNAKSAALAIASQDALSGVTAVLAHQDASRVSVWAVDASQRLFSLNNAVGATDGWSVPLQQREHVAHLAARRNQKRSTNELFVSSTDNSLITYLFQDPSTSAWQNTDMVLPTQQNGQEFPCYTTVVRFTDAQGAAIVGQTVDVNASEWTRAMVNGYWMDLDTSTRVQVQTDFSGTVTIINKVSDVGTPVYRFSAPFLSGVLTADPSVELRANLAQKLQSGDMSQWKKPDGTPVIPAGVDPNLVAQAQASLQQLMDNMGSLPADGSTAPTEPSAAPAPSMKVAHTTSFSVLGNVGNAIETAAGDVLQALKSAAGVVYEYVLQPIVSGAKTLLQFFVKIGEQVVTFVIRTLKEALQLISWLFTQLKVLVEDIIAFLGFLFAWDDILATQKALEAMTQAGLIGIAGKLVGMEPGITAFFDKLIDQWDAVCTKALGMPDVSSDQVIAQAQSTATPDQQAAVSCINTSPGATFSSYQIAHGGFADGTSDAPGNPVEKAITDFLKTVGNILSDVGASVQEICQDLQTMFQQGTFTLHGLVQVLAKEAVKALLGSVRDLLLGLCAVIADVTQAILQDVLLRPFNIPVLTWLYKKLTGEGTLTMLGAISLLAAIPLTVVYKLLTGEAPISAQAAPKLMLSVTDSKPVPARAYDYSIVGGGAAEIASIVYSACLYVNLLLKGSIKRRLVTSAQAVATVVAVMGTFPFDDIRAEQAVDRIVWLIDLVEAVVTSMSALMSWVPIKDAAWEATAVMLEKVDAGLLGIMGIVGICLSVVSYAMEWGEFLFGDRPAPYHSPTQDTEKFVANVIRYSGVTSEGLAGFVPSPAKEEILFFSVAAEGTALAFDLARWASVLLDNNANPNGPQKLFQPW
ncbi:MULTISPECIES: hypothetical protein [Corallococcus]|uniref:hypothetical protein n=1 Tax=Corallococcus TaxID=83461 RepID=UPI000EA1A7F2|nr:MULTISPECIES: hypothetical protein [Corallococcus]RKH33617.1 hypothetical protein D7X75_11440 [Corallococcus sp. CA031C]